MDKKKTAAVIDAVMAAVFVWVFVCLVLAVAAHCRHQAGNKPAECKGAMP